ncbi:hypothetical protein B0A49_11985, partial [Cryomyces minteri]
MRASVLLALSAAALSVALPSQAVLQDPQESLQQKYLIELSPGETRWVTEDEKWALRREGLMFFDITDTPDLGTVSKLSST